jgi:murein DD-endopeptidase MepM/ murein hydrolase activator NlpD
MSKIGAHVSGHPRHTFRDFLRADPAAVLGLNDSGIFTEVDEENQGHSYKIYRTTRVYGERVPDLHDPPGTYDQMAKYWWEEATPLSLHDDYAQNLGADFYIPDNEPTGGESDDPNEIRQNCKNVVAYERALMKLMNAAGFKMGVLALGGGSPGDFQIWKEICVPFIAEAYQTGNYYVRHAYEGNWDRVYREAQYLLDNGLGYGGMFVTEWGFDGGYGQIHDVQKIKDEDAVLAAFPNVVAFCLWEYGDTEFHANIDGIVPQLIPYMQANQTPKWKPGTPLPNKTLEEFLWDESVAEQKRVGLSLNPEAALQKKLNSLQLQVVHNEATRKYGNDSYVIQGGESLAGAIPRHTAVYQPGKPVWTITDPYQQGGDPLAGLVIKPPFRVPFVMTSPFGVKRDYDGDGVYDDFHEGVDYDVTTGESDSKEPILAGYPGTVVKSGPSGGKYGYRTVIECDYKGTTFFLWYCHMDSVYVSVGARVGIGTHLGELGNTGGNWGEHVHINLQLTEGGNEGQAWAVQHVVDPNTYIDKTVDPIPTIYIPRYFFPEEGNYGRIFMLVHTWDGNRERVQLQRDGNYSYVVKNQLWERRYVGQVNIENLFDTSPRPGEYYEAIGPWLPKEMIVGQVFQRTERVQFYRKNDCKPVGPPYVSSTILKLAAHYPSMQIGGLAVQDVIRLEWYAENRLDETYWYAKGLGLVRWKKYTGEESWIQEWVVGQENNTREVIGCL